MVNWVFTYELHNTKVVSIVAHPSNFENEGHLRATVRYSEIVSSSASFESPQSRLVTTILVSLSGLHQILNSSNEVAMEEVATCELALNSSCEEALWIGMLMRVLYYYDDAVLGV